MKKSMIVIGVLCAASAAWATLVTDDFDRADAPGGVDGTNDTSFIGANWKQDAASADKWFIYSNQLRNKGVDSLNIIYNDELATTSGNGDRLTLSGHIASKVSTAWVGLVFNYQDDDNFYVIRFKSDAASYQLLRWVDGGVGVIQSSVASENFIEDAYYKISVTSDAEYTYSFDISLSGTTVGSGVNRVDANSSHTGGYAGYYAGLGGYSAGFENFSLEVAPPEPGFDDFNRADVAVTSDVSLLGGDWAQDFATDEWTLVSGAMHSHALSAPGILYNTGLETMGGVNTNFTLRVDVSSKSPNLWSGIVFNYQDSDNYYGLRFREGTSEYQLFAVVGGVLTALVNASNASTTFAEDIYYTLNVESDGFYDFDFTITEVGSSTALNPITNAVDSGNNFVGGYAGLYAPHTGYASKFDNFVLQLVEVPVVGYAGWAQGWGVDIGEGTTDYDLDGLVNIYEYGLGGDPTNDLDQGMAPTFGIVDDGGSNVFSYVHPQLADPNSGLAYFLETSTDLITGTWTNSGYSVAGTNVTGGELDFVTNVTDTVEGKKFIRLIIE